MIPRRNRHLQPKKKPSSKSSKPYVPISSVYGSLRPLIKSSSSPSLDLSQDYLSILERMSNDEIIKALRSPSLKPSEAKILFERLLPHQRRALLEERALHEYSATTADASTGGYDGGGPKALFTPNYPPGLAFTTGLIGWYDASQPSSIISTDPGTVAEWKNLFNGATKGAAVMPSLVAYEPIINPPTYVTNQSYTWNVNSGTKPGVYCYSDGNYEGNGQNLVTGSIGSLFNTKNLLIVMAIKSLYIGGGSGNSLTIFDQSSNDNHNTVSMFVNRPNPASTSFYVQDNINGAYLDTGIDFVKGVQLSENGANSRLKAIYGSNTGTTATISTVSNSTPYDPPWDQFTIGDSSNGGISTLVGEILVYNGDFVDRSDGASGSGNIFKIQSYLYNKWK
jgi:hypothetical protein